MISRILPVIFIVISIGLFALYVQPTFAGPITELQSKIADYDNALAAAAKFKAQEQKLTTARAAMDPAAISRLATLLPDGVDNVQLILDLDAAAARAGLKLSDFSVRDAKAAVVGAPSTSAPSIPGGGGSNPGTTLQSGGPTDSFDLSVKAIGSYGAFRSFIAATEQSLRILDVVDVAIEGKDTGIYEYTITFRIYSLR